MFKKHKRALSRRLRLGKRVMVERKEAQSAKAADKEVVPKQGQAAGAGLEVESSFAKWCESLRLNRLPGARKRRAPLAGLAVLDLGCGDGAFCAEALRQEARRVVGIEQDERHVQLARASCPEAEFIEGSWWELPEERFDLIVVGAGLHYEPDLSRLFDRLRGHLARGGRLVLECAVMGPASLRRWQVLQGKHGLRKHPSMRLLVDVLLKDYAVRFMGTGIQGSDDPVPRLVFHCNHHDSTALLIGAPGGSGKTILTRQFLNAGWPDISTDNFIHKLLHDRHYAWRPIAQHIRQLVGDAPLNRARVGEQIAEDKAMLEEFCDVLVAEAPVEAPFFYIEGAMLHDSRVKKQLVSLLKEKGVRPWVVSPA